MTYLPFILYIAATLCFIGLVAYFGIFLYRRTGLCSAIWLALYLAANFAVGLLGPTLSKGWLELLPEALDYGEKLPWGKISTSEFIMTFTYVASIPSIMATLLVTVLIVADAIRLLERLAINVDSEILTRLLSIHRHHSIWGIAVLCLVVVSPLVHIAMAHYLSTISTPLTESFRKELFPTE